MATLCTHKNAQIPTPSLVKTPLRASSEPQELRPNLASITFACKPRPCAGVFFASSIGSGHGATVRSECGIVRVWPQSRRGCGSDSDIGLSTAAGKARRAFRVRQRPPAGPTDGRMSPARRDRSAPTPPSAAPPATAGAPSRARRALPAAPDMAVLTRGANRCRTWKRRRTRSRLPRIARVTERRAKRDSSDVPAAVAARKAKGRPELSAEASRAKVSWERRKPRPKLWADQLSSPVL
jgi:hypothetical protein